MIEWLWRASNSRVLGVVTDAKGGWILFQYDREPQMISRAVTEHLDHFHKRIGCSHWPRWCLQMISHAVTAHRTIFTERMKSSHWQWWCPYIKPAMERSRTDWMKTAGKQRFRRTKASLYAYLKFSPMNYISTSILIFYLFIIIRKLHNHLISAWLRFTRWP